MTKLLCYPVTQACNAKSLEYISESLAVTFSMQAIVCGSFVPLLRTDHRHYLGLGAVFPSRGKGT